MGFAEYKGSGYYPDGTNKETEELPKESEPIIPASDTTTPELVPKVQELGDVPDESLSRQSFIFDTFHNMTSVNTDRRASTVEDLRGFAEGTPTIVTYYKLSYAESDTQGVPNAHDVMQHRAHKSTLKIHGFEIRILGSIQFEHDTADNVVTAKGEAVTYPGFQPSKGDKFILELENGKYGEMEVYEVPYRMAIKSSSYYKIQFQLGYWIDDKRIQQLDDAVITEAWFDKQRFLNEPGALLYRAEYMDMKFFELQSAQMVTYYNSKFLDKQVMFSYMRPDSIYDAYLTDFMLKITEFNEAGQVAAQLFRDAPCIEVSIWRALLSDTVPLAAVPTSAVVLTRSLGSKTVMANSLINRKYVAWEEGSISLLDFFEQEDASSDDEEDTTASEINPTDLSGGDDASGMIGDLLLHIHPHFRECVLTCCGDCLDCCGDTVSDDSNSSAAYILDGDDDYRTLIRTFLRYRKINLDALRKCIKGVYKLPSMDKFYKMPVLIFLARTAIRYIHHSVGIFE